VKLVSVNEGITFDADDPGSFFYAGLMLLKGEDEIIRNRGRINMGIYTGKKKEGRYLNRAPFGYLNTRDSGNKPIIVVNRENEHIVRYIFSAYMNNVPVTEIYKHSVLIGFAKKGHSAITNILKNPVYTGLIHVSAYKENLEELVEGIHEAIISRTVWNEVQLKIKGRDKPVQVINDTMPLRSVLRCHCGKVLTGAPSTGKLGNIYYYYKCQTSVHNNISVIKAHSQLLQVFEYMSLPEKFIIALRDKSEETLEQRLTDNRQVYKQKQRELNEVETKLVNVEDKWISNQMTFEAYQRWYPDLTNKRMALKAQIDELSQDQEQVWLLLQQEMSKLVRPETFV
jgi:site-specific DNA recombinase